MLMYVSKTSKPAQIWLIINQISHNVSAYIELHEFPDLVLHAFLTYIVCFSHIKKSKYAFILGFENDRDVCMYLFIPKEEVERWTNWEYYIANINLESCVLYKAKRPIDHIQPSLITNMSTNTPSHSIIQLRYWRCIRESKSIKYKGMQGVQGKTNRGWISFSFYMLYI
mgnify:CR=1 FL=1